MYKLEIPIPYAIRDLEEAQKFVELLAEYHQHIDCLYAPLGFIRNDVAVWGIRAPTFATTGGTYNVSACYSWDAAWLEVARRAGLPVKVLMNDTFNRHFSSQEELGYMQKKLEWIAGAVDVHSICISDSTLLDSLKTPHPFSLSTNSHTSYSDLDFLFLHHGAKKFKSICLQRDLNRRLAKLDKYIASRQQYGLSYDQFVLMVNEGCAVGCTYKQAGDVEISTQDAYRAGANTIHAHGCTRIGNKLPWQFLASGFMTHDMVPPRIQHIKLSGRDLSVARIREAVEHYVGGKSVKLSTLNNVGVIQSSTSELSDRWKHQVTTCNSECLICTKCEVEYTRLSANVIPIHKEPK